MNPIPFDAFRMPMLLTSPRFCLKNIKKRVPVIGIGAGGDVDGQVLVVQDMLGMNNGFRPRFLRRYADLHTVMTDAISRYVSDVKNLDFPNEKEQY